MIRRRNRKGLAAYLNSHPHPGGIIVSEKHRFIYMKPCRTGGTSILRKVLEQMPLETFHYKDDRGRFLKWLEMVTDDALADYQIFSFVRNPWDRAVSIARYFDIPIAEFASVHRRLIAGDQNLRQHSLPCHCYTHVKGIPFVDMIGRFEQLERDFRDICKSLDISPPDRLPHANASERTHYTDYFDCETQSLVQDIYQQDVELFNYRF